MTKSLRVTDGNRAEIEALLLTTNGRADAHTYTTFGDVAGVVVYADKLLLSLGVSKSASRGAIVRSTSGNAVSNAYAKKGRTRAATSITLERRATGWLLIDAQKCNIWREGGSTRLYLTQAQADIATKHNAARYIVQMI